MCFPNLWSGCPKPYLLVPSFTESNTRMAWLCVCVCAPDSYHLYIQSCWHTEAKSTSIFWYLRLSVTHIKNLSTIRMWVLVNVQKLESLVITASYISASFIIPVGEAWSTSPTRLGDVWSLSITAWPPFVSFHPYPSVFNHKKKKKKTLTYCLYSLTLYYTVSTEQGLP